MRTERSHRVAEQIQHELAQIIPTQLRDPRIGMITLTSVDLSPDCSQAKVFFTKIGESADIETTSKGLEHAAGFLRAQLARRLALRITPKLVFVYDASVERGARLSKLIDDAVNHNPIASSDD